MLSAKEEKSIIALVAKHNPGFENKNHQIKPREHLPNGAMYSVFFERANGGKYENIVFKRGNDLLHYHNPPDVLQRLRELVPVELDPEHLNRQVVAGVVGVLTLALVVGAFTIVEPKNLAMLAGIWGTAFGYFLPRPRAGTKQ
jgi:hypothetical protein